MRIRPSQNYLRFVNVGPVLALAAVLIAGDAIAVEKLVDTVMFPHDPSPNGVFRWSEGSILNLDDKNDLMMLVTASAQGGDWSPAKILEFRSADGGITWTPLAEARVFQDGQGRNVTSPSLLRLDNGHILGFFSVRTSVNDEGGPWMRRSTDNGQSWTEPQQLPYSGYGIASSDRAMQLRGGRILVPAWQSNDKLRSTYAYSFYSDDRGQTWHKTDLITTPKRTEGPPVEPPKGSIGQHIDPSAEEPAVVELKDGRLLMFIRNYSKTIFRSYSDDQGSTWSPPESTGIPSPGSQPTLTRLPNGDLLLIWNWAPAEEINGPWPRKFISTAISKDEGRTFSSLRHLDGAADFAGKITMAYAEPVGDNLVVAYSKSESMKNTYSWRLQVLPMSWLYEGDNQHVFGTPDDAPSKIK